jgi:nitroimidazol reductase NimA-like FMN-containing flavoprotein (pyridoxamine 5'-phosphate oxidase superfamily)
MNGMRALTEDEKEAFLKDNHGGVLAFAGDKPYCIPIHYAYTKGTVVFEMLRAGRKMEYINKSRKVCFSVWQEAAQSNIPSLKKERWSSVILEGELEEVTKDKWDYYELPKGVPEGIDMVGWILKVNTVGTVCAPASLSFGGETA